MSDTERKPDYICEMTLYGTTYEICAYFDGKQTLAEIMAKRILQEISKKEADPTAPDPEKEETWVDPTAQQSGDLLPPFPR